MECGNLQCTRGSSARPELIGLKEEKKVSKSIVKTFMYEEKIFHDYNSHIFFFKRLKKLPASLVHVDFHSNGKQTKSIQTRPNINQINCKKRMNLKKIKFFFAIHSI